MYTLHIGNKNYSSWSLRPWALLAELGIPFEERLHPFGPNFGAIGADLLPSGKVPCLHDAALRIWDSLAIAEYLAERHPAVWPSDPVARAWARCAAAEMHSGFQSLRSLCGMNCGVRVKLHSIPAPLAADLARIDALWREGLARFGGPFLAGAGFSAVDAFFCPVAFRVQSYDLPVSADAKRYAERLLALPSMRRWYAEALAEPWRDPAHEVELTAGAEIVADLRTGAAAPN